MRSGDDIARPSQKTAIRERFESHPLAWPRRPTIMERFCFSRRAPRAMSVRKYLKAIPLSRKFYDRPAELVAPQLLGKLLIRQGPEGLCIGRIVETEAYLSTYDPACHAHKGMTRKNASMFGPPGHAYVYMIHAKWCFNTVTEPTQRASAVLVRAVEPLVGIEFMQVRRSRETLLDLARGPARMCQAFDITREFDGWDLAQRKSLWIADDGHAMEHPIVATPRIGISQGTDLPLRFLFANNPFVSGKKVKHLAG
jgi:DNA-3-methyladenine glycosylase